MSPAWWKRSPNSAELFPNFRAALRFRFRESAQNAPMRKVQVLPVVFAASLLAGAASVPSAPPRVVPASYGVEAEIPALRPAILPPLPAVTDKGAEVQLGAYRDETVAALEWNRMAGEAPGLFSGLMPEIVVVDLPGRGRFYRLRAGPLAADSPQALCGKLKTRGLACIPVSD